MTNNYTLEEITQTLDMVGSDKLDIRTVTMGINLLPAIDKNINNTIDNIRSLLKSQAKDLVSKAENIEKRFAMPIVNKRITVTPISLILSAVATGNKQKDLKSAYEIAKILDQSATELSIDFIGGYGALVENGMTYSDKVLIESLPQVLTSTKTVCAFINIGTSRSGINMDGVAKMGSIIHQTSQQKNGHIGCAKLVVFCNSVSDNPFMAGGYHGIDQPDTVLHVGISGPGTVRKAIESIPTDTSIDQMANQIQKTAFKISRAGELIGETLAKELKIKLGSIDLSLAPTTELGDSVGLILEKMGLESTGAHGTTAALALLTDAVKKGGMMASTKTGGLSGAFIPVSEDLQLAEAAAKGILTIDKLEAMTSVCSVGLDMIAIPGDTPSSTIAGIIADEAAIGMINHKTTAVRLIPVKNKHAGDQIVFGGLLGQAPIIKVNKSSSEKFIWRKGFIPAPVTSKKN